MGGVVCVNSSFANYLLDPILYKEYVMSVSPGFVQAYPTGKHMSEILESSPDNFIVLIPNNKTKIFICELEPYEIINEVRFVKIIIGSVYDVGWDYYTPASPFTLPTAFDVTIAPTPETKKALSEEIYNAFLSLAGAATVQGLLMAYGVTNPVVAAGLMGAAAIAPYLADSIGDAFTPVESPTIIKALPANNVYEIYPPPDQDKIKGGIFQAGGYFDDSSYITILCEDPQETGKKEEVVENIYNIVKNHLDLNGVAAGVENWEYAPSEGSLTDKLHDIVAEATDIVLANHCGLQVNYISNVTNKMVVDGFEDIMEKLFLYQDKNFIETFEPVMSVPNVNDGTNNIAEILQELASARFPDIYSIEEEF